MACEYIRKKNSFHSNSDETFDAKNDSLLDFASHYRRKLNAINCQIKSKFSAKNVWSKFLLNIERPLIVTHAHIANWKLWFHIPTACRIGYVAEDIISLQTNWSKKKKRKTKCHNYYIQQFIQQLDWMRVKINWKI